MRRYRDRVNWHCRAGFNKYRALGECTDTADGPLIHIDNGGQILAVAHLDAVGFGKPTWKGDRVQCMQLDDRLGVWVLLDLLPSLGCVPFDILLTDSEEVGRSTAQYLDAEIASRYNWMFEFDRAGSDCVMYDYEDEETTTLAEQYGWAVGYGSFTDICSLEHAGIKGFNFGTGYHNQHTHQCYADLSETIASAKRFVDMAADLHKVRLEHAATEWYDAYSDRNEICTYCGELLDREWYYCPMCGTVVAHHCDSV